MSSGGIAQNIPQDSSLPVASEPIGTLGPNGPAIYLTRAWYIFFETVRTRTGGDVDKVNNAFVGLDAKVNTSTEVETGNGLTGGGNLSASITISIPQQAGWTAGTGTASKGAFAAYAGQTWGSSYSQTVAQSADDALKAVSERLLAIEQALATGGIINA